MVAFDINLLADVEGLHFAAAKNYLFKLTGRSMSVAQMGLLRNVNFLEGTLKLLETSSIVDPAKVGEAVTAIKAKFDEHKKTLKPRLPAHFLVERLHAAGTQVLAYSFYEEDINLVLQAELLKLFHDLPLVPAADLLPALDTALQSGISCTVMTNGALASLHGSASSLGKGRMDAGDGSVDGVRVCAASVSGV